MEKPTHGNLLCRCAAIEVEGRDRDEMLPVVPRGKRMAGGILLKNRTVVAELAKSSGNRRHHPNSGEFGYAP
jgi:hypothetical protein